MKPNEVVKALADSGTCPQHPRYGKKRKPRGTCENCWFLWFLTALTSEDLKVEIVEG